MLIHAHTYIFMVAKIICGKLIAKEIIKNFHKEFLDLIYRNKLNFKPKLVIYLLNNTIPSQIYINQKVKLAKKLNIDVNVKLFNDNVSENEIIESLKKENYDKNVNSVIVQLPLSKKLCGNDTTIKILDSISPIKDVDGLTTFNRIKLEKGEFEHTYLPPTVLGIMSIIASQQNVSGNKIAIIGHGPTLG